MVWRRLPYWLLSLVFFNFLLLLFTGFLNLVELASVLSHHNSIKCAAYINLCPLQESQSLSVMAHQLHPCAVEGECGIAVNPVPFPHGKIVINVALRRRLDEQRFDGVRL